MAPDLRFYKKGQMHALLEHQSEVVSKAVRSLDPDVVLNTPVQDLVELLYEKYRVEPVVLDLAARRSSGAKDVSIPIDSRSGRAIEVDGTRIEVLIPFAGDDILLDIRASTYNMNPPRFDVRGKDIVVAHEGRAPLDSQQAKAAIDKLVTSIELHLNWQCGEIDPWNERLLNSLAGQVEARRAKVLQDRELDAFLEVPVVGRPNASTSFNVDPPRRQHPVAVERIRSSPGFGPEPAISDEGFAAILSEIESVTTAVQRLPKTFAAMPEESLRDVLLVVLNNRFGPATGETFSRRGKTDIYIPWEGDERAVFIAECKWWKGPANFVKAIEQLFGYLTWRDSRAALIVFVRDGSPTEIGEKADATLQAHESFKRMSEKAGQPTYTLASRDDTRRELHVALLIIPVLLLPAGLIGHRSAALAGDGSAGLHEHGFGPKQDRSPCGAVALQLDPDCGDHHPAFAERTDHNRQETFGHRFRQWSGDHVAADGDPLGVVGHRLHAIGDHVSPG